MSPHPTFPRPRRNRSGDSLRRRRPRRLLRASSMEAVVETEEANRSAHSVLLVMLVLVLVLLQFRSAAATRRAPLSLRLACVRYARL